MDIRDLFHSASRRIAEFFEIQLHLYRHDIGLQDYFLPLQLDTMRSARAKPSDARRTSGLGAYTIRAADRASQIRPRRKIKTDVLFCPAPYFGRKSESRFLVRTLLGLAQTDATILCLLPADAPSRDELDAQLSTAGRTGQVAFLDPATSGNRLEAHLRPTVARMRGRSAFEQAVAILEPHGLSPSREVIAGFEHTAYFVDAWERLAPFVEFDAVVARCHWHTLCSSVCRTAQQRGKPVITFQQGVIGHTLDVPVTASKYVAFGQASSSFLARMNRTFFQAVKKPEPAVEYINGGCLFDTVSTFPDQFERQTLLIVDVPNEPADFYGLESQCRALLQLAAKLLAADFPLRRLIIRPHPYWTNLDFEACQNLVRQDSTRCELSHPSWPLEDDLHRSSVVVGIFSGVLTVASACGLPTIFLKTEQGYSTSDLECFSLDQTLLPDEAFCEVGKLLRDRTAYAEARTQALRNAREYYANGTNLTLDGEFFKRLLSPEPGAVLSPA